MGGDDAPADRRDYIERNGCPPVGAIRAWRGPQDPGFGNGSSPERLRASVTQATQLAPGAQRIAAAFKAGGGPAAAAGALEDLITVAATSTQAGIRWRGFYPHSGGAGALVKCGPVPRGNRYTS